MSEEQTETQEIPAGFTREEYEEALALRAEATAESDEPPKSEKQEPQNEKPPKVEETNAPTEGNDESASESNPFTFTVKGEDKEFTKDQIQHMLSREQTFQQKYEEMRKSETSKLGMLMEAAKGGDAGAQKKILEQLKEYTGNDVYELEDVEQEFDLDKHVESKEENELEDQAFADVKNDLDFEKTLDKMKEHFPTRMPAKLFQSYWSNPDERRVMYDIAASGRADEIFDALDGELNKLSLADKIKIKQDPDAYALAVVEAINGLNAPQQSASPKDLGQTKLDAVSTGQGSRRQEKEESPPDFSKMSDKEFREFQLKHFGKVL